MSAYFSSDQSLCLASLLYPYRVAVNGSRDALEPQMLAAIGREAALGKFDQIAKVLEIENVSRTILLRAIDALAKSPTMIEKLAAMATRTDLGPVVRSKLFDVLAEKGMLMTLLDIYAEERATMNRLLLMRLSSRIEKCIGLCKKNEHATTLSRAMTTPIALDFKALHKPVVKEPRTKPARALAAA